MKPGSPNKHVAPNQFQNDTSSSNYWPQPYATQQNYPNTNQQMAITDFNQYEQYQNYYHQNQGYVKDQQYDQQYYPHQISQPYVQQPGATVPDNHPAEKDNDPWNWGWEDNNSSQSSVNQSNKNLQDSFANDKSWNWTVEDSNINQTAQNEERVDNITVKTQVQNVDLQINSSEKLTTLNQSTHNITEPENTHQVATDQFPKHISVSKLKNENLTPQWSIESQVSQDSSDDVLLTSESDNRSNVLSRSSTVSHSPSRPSSTHENIVDYTSNQSKYDNLGYQKLGDQHKIGNKVPNQDTPNLEVNITTEFENLNQTMQDLTLTSQFENKEIVTPENFQLSENEILQSKIEDDNQILLPCVETKELHQKSKEEIRHPAPLTEASTSVPVPQSYKRNPILNQNITTNLKFSKENLSTANNSEVVAHSTFLNKNQQSSRQDNHGVNLETLPDNSERPDQPFEQMQVPVKKSNIQKQWGTENCEIATINDRNQYLETGQLSDIDIPAYSESGENVKHVQSGATDFADSLPPPGLRRLVLGQLEHSEISQSIDNIDEPPPGLSRMVLGRTETDTSSIAQDTFNKNIADIRDNMEEPPVGLHRMVPGESSSPESLPYSRYLEIFFYFIF